MNILKLCMFWDWTKNHITVLYFIRMCWKFLHIGKIKGENYVLI